MRSAWQQQTADWADIRNDLTAQLAEAHAALRQADGFRAALQEIADNEYDPMVGDPDYVGIARRALGRVPIVPVAHAALREIAALRSDNLSQAPGFTKARSIARAALAAAEPTPEPEMGRAMWADTIEPTPDGWNDHKGMGTHMPKRKPRVEPTPTGTLTPYHWDDEREKLLTDLAEPTPPAEEQ